MKRFTLTRGSEVLAEGVVWTTGGGMIMPAEGGLPWSFANAVELGSKLNLDVSIVWIDETHEAKPAPQFAPAVALTKHRELMAEWRERNDGGDCGRVANELVWYIDEVLVPVERGDKAHQKLEPPTPVTCRLCGGDGSQGRPFCSSPGCAHRPQVKVEQMRQAADKAPSYEELRRTVATYCPSLVGFLPPEPAPPNPAPPGATRGGPATTREYVREQVTRGLPKGKLPSERGAEILAKSPNKWGIREELSVIWNVLDEFVGRKAP